MKNICFIFNLTLFNDFLLVYIVDSNDKIIIICVAGGSRAEKHLLANWDQTMCSYKHRLKGGIQGNKKGGVSKT